MSIATVFRYSAGDLLRSLAPAISHLAVNPRRSFGARILHVIMPHAANRCAARMAYLREIPSSSFVGLSLFNASSGASSIIDSTNAIARRNCFLFFVRSK